MLPLAAGLLIGGWTGRPSPGGCPAALRIGIGLAGIGLAVYLFLDTW